ncbi:MAG TPA: hypothetical protein DCW35_01010 [Polynucleobacter sp.]|nr:hypothetical protein [Polynucleobacter sp.]
MLTLASVSHAGANVGGTTSAAYDVAMVKRNSRTAGSIVSFDYLYMNHFLSTEHSVYAQVRQIKTF